MSRRKKTVLGVLIPLLIAAAMFASVYFFMEVEIRGVICFVRKFYDTPWDAMEKGGRITYQLTEYGMDADHTTWQVIPVDETNAICVFCCEYALVIEELYTKDGGYRVVGTETITSYDSVRERTELGDLDYVELWLLLPNGRYGKKCSYAIRADAAEAPAGAAVYPIEVQGETWSVIVTDPK